MSESQVFTNALKRATPAARAAYLDEACAGNPRLRADVETLLQAHAADPGFLEQPAGSLGEWEAGGSSTAPPSEPPPEPGGTEQPGLLLAGRYKLLEAIGAGGMGTVWMARQTEPVQRLVAVKLIKTGMDSKTVLARFEAERQALALMDHPNVAKVLDAGRAPDGRPFFTMELVKGVPITRYCDEHHLTPRQRLELFVPVCQAIQHAHTKGVIHRDVKPSNVLVALYDDRPVPKVIDFGVAKATGQQLTERSLHTGFGAVVGTVEYMSPEQASFNQLDVDTRSDVYALGVLLYELLAGSPPFTRQELEKAGMLEMLRVIREQEPSKPSTKLSTAEGLPTLAANRGMEPAKLAKLVRGELDWIVMKALEKDRNRRYETANGLARDVQRYLADEAVQASPPSAWYRVRKFARRNKRALVTAAAGAVLLVLVTVGAVVMAIREQRLRGAVEQARDELERNLYFSRISLVGQKLAADDRGRVAELLEECPPPLRDWEWYYLKRWYQVGPYVELRVNAKPSYFSCVFSPDGRRLAVSFTDGSINVWDATIGQQIRTLRGHAGAVHGVAFDPSNARHLASAGQDGTVRMWEPGTGQVMRTLRAHDGEVRSVTFSPDGRYFASSGADRTVKVWDAATGELLRACRGSTDLPRAVAYSPDGRLLAASSIDGVVKIWEAATGKEVRTFKGHKANVGSVAFSPDGRRLASSSWDMTVRVWDPGTGQEELLLSGHNAPVVCVAFSPDGRRLASGGGDKTVRLWDAKTGQELLALHGHTDSVYGLAFSPDGRRLASAGQDQTVKIWDAAPPDDKVSHEVFTLHGHTHMVWGVTFSPDGERIATSGADWTLKIWDARTGQECRTLRGHTLPVHGVAFSPDGRRLVSGSPDKAVKVWDAASGRELLTLPFPKLVWSVAFSPDGGRIAAAGLGGEVRVWEAATGREVVPFRGDDDGIERVAFSPDSRFLATAGYDKTVKLWDARTGQHLRTFVGHGHVVRDVAFAPDGRRLASGSYDGTVRVWDVATGQAHCTLTNRAGKVQGVAFHPDGRRVAAGSEDGTVKLWDAQTGRLLRTYRGHCRTVRQLAFSPDGRRLASASWDKTIKVWDATLTAREWHGPEAGAVVQDRFAKLFLRDEVLMSLRADATLREEVRQVALELAEEEEEDPRRLNQASRVVIKAPGGDGEAYRRALRYAEAACRLAPEHGYYLGTLGGAQYRLGQHAEAVATLTRSEQLCAILVQGPDPADLAFLAMAQYRAGREEQARLTLGRARAAMKTSGGAADGLGEDRAALLGEAERLSQGAPGADGTKK